MSHQEMFDNIRQQHVDKLVRRPTHGYLTRFSFFLAKSYPKILHAEYPLGEAFDIADEAQSEDDVPKLVVAGHVAPPVEQGAYKIKFLKLGRPPAYSGQTSLTIRSQDRRVLMLPATNSG